MDHAPGLVKVPDTRSPLGGLWLDPVDVERIETRRRAWRGSVADPRRGTSGSDGARPGAATIGTMGNLTARTPDRPPRIPDRFPRTLRLALGVTALAVIVGCSPPAEPPPTLTPSAASERCAQANGALEDAWASVQELTDQLRAWSQENPGQEYDDATGDFIAAASVEYTDEELRDGAFSGYGLAEPAAMLEELRRTVDVARYLIVGDPECFDPALVAQAKAALDG